MVDIMPILYTSVPLDRASELRRDEQVMATFLAHPDKKVIPVWRDLSLLGDGAAIMTTGPHAISVIERCSQAVFLGRDDTGAPFFAADLSDCTPKEDGSGPDLGVGGAWMGLRTQASTLPAGQAALLGYARAILIWHRRNHFCGTCGAPTTPREGGHVRQCSDSTCATLTYPRTDPAVIMLVADGDKVLLHRQRIWPQGQWSILAGFVEPGETMEEAVVREVREETRIEIADVTYYASQPWPYPSSVMVAFTARATGGILTPDPHELEDARWFHRDDILANFDDRHRGKDTGLCLPTRGSIARALMEDWLARRL